MEDFSKTLEEDYHLGIERVKGHRCSKKSLAQATQGLMANSAISLHAWITLYFYLEWNFFQAQMFGFFHSLSLSF